MNGDKKIKKILNYLLVKKIGQGATAEVYQAYNISNLKLSAVKVFSFLKLKKHHSSDFLKNELELLKALSHKNIINIHDTIQTANNVYVVMQYCNGNTLNHYKTEYNQRYQKQLPEAIIQKILRQLIQGLHFIHQSKCIHRDIKLDNILLNFDNIPNVYSPKANDTLPIEKQYSVDEPFTVKIADLGFARALNERNIASTICGSPITMAPDVFNWTENIDQSHCYNEKADLWSLGVLTYELLIGKPPFFNQEQNKLFQMVKEGKYSIPKEMRLSIEAISFINGLLQFYPDNRMNWEQILSHPFITKEFDQLHLVNLESVSSKYCNDKDIVFNVKERNEFKWLIGNSLQLTRHNSNENNNQMPLKPKEDKNKEIVTIPTEETDKMTNKEMNELMKQMIEENKQLKKTIDDMKVSLLKNQSSKSENEQLKDQIKIKTEENQRLITELQKLQNKRKSCLEINENYFSSKDDRDNDSNKKDLNINDTIASDWEIINDGHENSQKRPNNKKELSNDDNNSDNHSNKNKQIVVEIINDFIK